MSDLELIDRHIPRRGQCGICGVPGMDARHRILDSIAGQVAAGDPIEAVAEDYDYPAEVVAAVCRQEDLMAVSAWLLAEARWRAEAVS